MLISEYISKDFPAFEVDSSAEEALEIASEFGFTHVFVQKNNFFLKNVQKILKINNTLTQSDS